MLKLPIVIEICAFVGLLVFGAAVGYAWASPQVVTQPVSPVVLSGADIGFRMVGRQGDKAVGTFVVRVNGEWVTTASQWDPKRAR